MSTLNYTYNNSRGTGKFFPFSSKEDYKKSSAMNFLYVKDNHLGNVHVVVSDRKIANDDNSDNIIDSYSADVIQAVDRYPGGFSMPGRSFSANSYSYGYNAGSEKDDEITGVTGSHFTTFFREGDTRLWTWWSIDPKYTQMPWQSPYSYMNGNPITGNDPLGDRVKVRKLQKKDPEAFKQLKDDLEQQTGLELVVKKGFLITNDKRRGSQLRFKGGSREAREQLLAAIDDKKTFKIKPSNEGSFYDGKSTIFLSSKHIEDFMRQAFSVGLNPKTVGYGLTLFHELDHARAGTLDPSHPESPLRATFEDRASLERGPTVDAVNRIRMDLSALGISGGNYGIRTSYFIRVGNSKIVPFNTVTKENIIKTGIIKGQYIKYDPVIPKDATPSEINNLFDGQIDFKK